MSKATYFHFAIANGFDVSDADSIEIIVQDDGRKSFSMWMNIDGVLSVRAFRIKEIILKDNRHKQHHLVGPDTD